MTRDARFWRNVTIVGLIHVIVLVGLLWWSRAPQRTPKDIVWMEGGAGAESAASSQPATPPPENAPVETHVEVEVHVADADPPGLRVRVHVARRHRRHTLAKDGSRLGQRGRLA